MMNTIIIKERTSWTINNIRDLTIYDVSLNDDVL